MAPPRRCCFPSDLCPPFGGELLGSLLAAMSGAAPDGNGGRSVLRHDLPRSFAYGFLEHLEG